MSLKEREGDCSASISSESRRPDGSSESTDAARDSGEEKAVRSGSFAGGFRLLVGSGGDEEAA